MSQATAVLSYTRKDDQFFGGYITAFRKTLESAVHVVSGTEDFRIFQDVEGILLGEQWEKKLADVIGAANFLVPMVSPLFFRSEHCRMEVELFLERERGLQRDDLILPVYFLSTPRLDKDEEKGKDPLAVELARRQMFDWREHANVPLQEPAARTAILTLARAVAAAVDRLEAGRELVPSPEEANRDTSSRTRAAAHAHAESVTRTHGAARREMPSERVILWADDRPDNNRWERRALEAYGVRFELALDTDQARAALASSQFAAVISDMSRPGDRSAGYTLLDHLRSAGISVPYFIYAGSRAPEYVREARSRGAAGVTNDPDELIEMVVGAIR
jgi:CheY-like chemotaxis protein